jgi:uncharacterized membrane protein HdeD (DUF308 family)
MLRAHSNTYSVPHTEMDHKKGCWEATSNHLPAKLQKGEIKMAEILTRNWWMVVLRGVLAILFGIAAFVWPGPTVAALVILFGAYALVDGIFAIGTGIAGWDLSGSSRWWLVLGGIAGVIVGLITFVYPNITAEILLYFIGAWAIVTGIFEVIAAIQLRQVIDNEWLLVFSGILSVAFGVLVFVYPQASALSILWMIAIYAILFGLALIGLGFRMKGLGTAITSGSMGKA